MQNPGLFPLALSPAYNQGLSSYPRMRPDDPPGVRRKAGRDFHLIACSAIDNSLQDAGDCRDNESVLLWNVNASQDTQASNRERWRALGDLPGCSDGESIQCNVLNSVQRSTQRQYWIIRNTQGIKSRRVLVCVNHEGRGPAN